MAMFRVTVQTDKVGSTSTREFEVPDEELEECETEEDRRQLIDEYAREAMFEIVEWTWDAS